MVDFADRYERNHTSLSEAEQELLAQKHVLIIGCGGLGGYIIELMGRLGVGRITAVDGDSFAPSNLNRQLYSTVESLGKSKAQSAAERMAAVNPNVELRAVAENFTKENADALLEGVDLVIDALDNAASRLLMARKAAEHGITIVSGGIMGWIGRVLVLEPGDPAAEVLWNCAEVKNTMGNLGFTAACTAAMECAEAAKVLLGRPGALRGKMLEFSLLSGQRYELPLSFK